MAARGAVGSDASIEQERRNVRAFSLARSNIKGLKNWSRGLGGATIILLPFTWRSLTRLRWVEKFQRWRV